jgi:DNA topoisomerase-1
MVLRWGKYGRFLGCSGYPECKNIRGLEKPVDTGVRCPECKQGNLQQRKSRRGKLFYSCERYPDCKFAVWDKPVAEACPQCGFPITVEKITKRAGRVRQCHKKECGYKLKIDAPVDSEPQKPESRA